MTSRKPLNVVYRLVRIEKLMKNCFFQIILFCLMFTVLTSRAFPELEYRKDQLMNQFIFNSLKIWHYHPLNIDDDLSVKSFDLLLKKFDSGKKFLLKSDVESLKKFEKLLDNDINQNQNQTLNFALGLLQQRIKFVESFYSDLLSKPFDFNKEENMETDYKKRTFPESEEELKELWRKILKYQTLFKYQELVLEKIRKDDKEKNNVKTSDKEIEEVPVFDPETEARARNEVAKSTNRQLKRLLKINYNDYMSLFLNSMLNSFDPHTVFFLPKSKEDFDIDLTGSLEGIGASLTEKDGYIKVAEIIPGSACWKQGQLQAEDLILKVAQGAGEPLDIVEMPVNEAVKYIRGKKGTEVRLTVKKPDGQIIVIPIIRDIVVIEESYAKALVLLHKNSEVRYGYINLPKFYHDFNQLGTKNSFSDVRQKLDELKKQQVSGLILDLRNNSGGSLHEAVKTSGLFIETGPVVQVRSKDDNCSVLEDTDPSVDYDGPVVILVNKFSASASEILAAALQDYKRAIIVGTDQTFGKGTVQTFVNLDQFLPPRYASYKPMGSFKLTIQKFYRINGDSTQYKGVIPDVVLPDPFGYVKVGEKEQEYSLPWDQIKPLQFTVNQKNAEIFPKVVEKSRKRVSENKTFTKLQEYIAKLKVKTENTLQSLKFDVFMTESIDIQKDSKYIKNLQPESKHIEIIQNDSTDTANGSETYKKRQKEMLEDITKDLFIYEAMSIIDDLNTESGL